MCERRSEGGIAFYKREMEKEMDGDFFGAGSLVGLGTAGAAVRLGVPPLNRGFNMTQGFETKCVVPRTSY